jgi:hypothetical protein
MKAMMMGWDEVEAMNNETITNEQLQMTNGK